MCCNVQVLSHITRSPSVRGCKKSRLGHWPCGLCRRHRVSSAKRHLSDADASRCLHDSPTSVLSSHAGCARSNVTLRPLLGVLMPRPEAQLQKGTQAQEGGAVPLTFGVKPERRTLDLILPVEYHWVMQEPVLALRTNP
ncbi:hypothetical protein GGI35DRAFT_326422 [Trichoderma velutinum]